MIKRLENQQKTLYVRISTVPRGFCPTNTRYHEKAKLTTNNNIS